VVGYKETGGSGYGCAKVGQVSGTTISSYGSENCFNSALTVDISATALDSTHFVAVYKDDGGLDYGCGRIGEVSGTTISSYGSENCFNSAATMYPSASALDSTHFAVAYRDDGGDDYGCAKVGEVSGTTISSYGSENCFNSVALVTASVSALDSTHFVVGYDGGSSTYGSAKIASLSNSTTISYGSESYFNQSWSDHLSVSSLDRDNFIVVYRDVSDQMYGRSKVGNVAGEATNLDYFIEDKSDGVEAKVWVEVDTIPASSLTTIWMWYGNAGASAGSNMANTGIFYDDFPGSSLDSGKWPNTSGSPAVSGGNLELSTASGTETVRSNVTFPAPTIMEYKAKQSNILNHSRSGFSNSSAGTVFNNDDAAYHFLVAIMGTYDNYCLRTQNEGTSEATEDVGTEDVSFHDHKIIWTASNVEFYVDDVLLGTHSTQVPNEDCYVRLENEYYSGTYIFYVDWVRARQYTSPEPIVGVGADIEFQTRTSSDGSTWEAWKPTTNETQIDDLDNNEESVRIYDWAVDSISTNQTWNKRNNTKPANSDGSSTDGRIPLGTTDKGDDDRVNRASVIKDGSTYKMWYSGGDGTYYRAYYATSPDGLTWTKYNNNAPSNSDSSSTDGRIPLGTTDKGDDYYVWAGPVVKDGSTYKMWYTGYDGTNHRIYYATSTDGGLVWTKYDNSIPDPSDGSSTNGRIPLGTSGKGDDEGARQPAVIKDGSTYKMWYSGYDGTNWRIYYATSSDGLAWTKYNNNAPSNSDSSSTDGRVPLGSSGKGDENGAHAPSVIKESSTYKMWYSGIDNVSDRGRTFYATSLDGLIWTKYNNDMPGTTWPNPSNDPTSDGRMSLGTLGKGDDWNAVDPHVIKEGGVYKNWYSGWQDTGRIYYATMTSSPLGDNTESDIKMEGNSSLIATVGAQLVGADTRGLWHLEETNGDLGGDDVFDETDYDNDGEFNGSGIATAVVDGVYGKARDFNGSNDYMILAPLILSPSKLGLKAKAQEAIKTSSEKTILIWVVHEPTIF
jgi:hypothetical protein